MSDQIKLRALADAVVLILDTEHDCKKSGEPSDECCPRRRNAITALRFSELYKYLNNCSCRVCRYLVEDKLVPHTLDEVIAAHDHDGKPVKLPPAPSPIAYSGPCLFEMAWTNCTTAASGSTFCDKHQKETCGNCGKPAVQECDHTGALVCGWPLCGTCRHPHG